MTTSPPIFVPTDFSEHSRSAIDLAAALAKQLHASLVVLHVAPSRDLVGIAGSSSLSPDTYAQLSREHQKQAEMDLARLQKQLAPLEVTALVRHGDIVETIVHAADEASARMIVMGSHGRGASRFLLGSVSEKVSRQAHCPVMVTPRHDEPFRVPFRKIVIGSDLTPFTETCVELAAELVDRDGRLDVVHVVPEVFPSVFDTAPGAWQAVEDATREDRKARAAELGEQLKKLDLPVLVAPTVEFGNAPTRLLDHAKDAKADLVVVGAHGPRDTREQLLGTVADRVLRHAAMPVLLARKA